MGGWTKTKLILFSTQVEDVVGVGVELGLWLSWARLGSTIWGWSLSLTWALKTFPGGAEVEIQLSSAGAWAWQQKIKKSKNQKNLCINKSKNLCIKKTENQNNENIKISDNQK